MADLLIQATLSNFLVACFLAVAAWLVHRRVHSVSLSNLLWALVLLKLLTPPVLSIPVLGIPSIGSLHVTQAGPPIKVAPSEDQGMGISRPDSPSALSGTGGAAEHSVFASRGIQNIRIAILVWPVVSGGLFVFSAFRIIRFHCMLKAEASVHEGLSDCLSVDVAKRFGLGKHPIILITHANIAPFVWWRAGRAVIVISDHAVNELSEEDLRLVVAHEMAHIKRRDHCFRWIEWFALIGLWWNPLMWWAREQLRMSEEMACDELVLEIAASEVHPYGNALLNLAELLTTAAIRPPTVASAINSGGTLEQRLKMMISGKTRKVSSSMRLAIVALATCVFPLSVVYAQNFEAVERRLGGAVEAGELSLEQANLMLETLAHSPSSREMKTREQRYERFMNEIKESVETGKLSEEEAEMKLAAVRREMFEARMRGEGKLSEVEAIKRRYKLFMEKIVASEAAGKLSEEEAEEQRVAVKREMFEAVNRGELGNREMETRTQRYQVFMNKIKEAAEAGELSEEEAEMKLAALRSEMFKAGIRVGDQLSKLKARKKHYELIMEQIKATVEAGKLSEEEAKAKLIHMKRELFEETK